MIFRKTVKIWIQEDEGVLLLKNSGFAGSQRREYKRTMYWFLFVPVYTTYDIIAKIK